MSGRWLRYHFNEVLFFFFNVPPPTDIYTLSLHDALPISQWTPPGSGRLTELSPTLLSLAPFVDQLTVIRSEEHTSELQSRLHLVCRLLLEKKKSQQQTHNPGT